MHWESGALYSDRKPDLAQGGRPNVAGLDEALAAVFEATLSIRQRSIFLHFYPFEREGSLAEHEMTDQVTFLRALHTCKSG